MNTDKILTMLRNKKINHTYLAGAIFCIGLGFLLLRLMIETYISWAIKHEIQWDSGAEFVLGIGFLITFLIFYIAVLCSKGVCEQ